MATSSGTPGIMWDRQREDVLSGHRCAPKDVKLANLHIIDRKVTGYRSSSIVKPKPRLLLASTGAS